MGATGWPPADQEGAKTPGSPSESGPKGRRFGPGGVASVAVMRLLVVEDAQDLASALRVGLGRAGYAVDIALTGADAVAKLGVNAYDLLVLDLNLPDTDGFTLCRGMRDGSIAGPSGNELRILMLTARGELADRVRGLDEGADDYLVKPFALAELMARARALLRRDNGGGAPPPPPCGPSPPHRPPPPPPRP